MCLIERVRAFLVWCNECLPERIRIVRSEQIRRLSQTAVTLLVAVLLVSSVTAAAMPLDSDGDGAGNAIEWMPQHESHWLSSDSDADGVEDGVEISSSTYNVSNPDTDGDGLNDSAERQFGSNASRVDTDSDEVLDPTEAEEGTDPAAVDTDGDSITDDVELSGATSARNSDSDFDGLNDGLEQDIGSNATNPDTDSDLVPDKREYHENTSLTRWDTDNDSLSDLREFLADRLNPRRSDTDDDGLDDRREVNMETLANVSDTDDDGLLDGPELQNGTVPTLPDSDNDTLQDGVEVREYGSDPLNADTDFDNVSDPIEVGHSLLNVTNSDVDDDGLNDGFEWYGKTNVTLSDTDNDGIGDWNETKSLPTDPVDNDTDSDLLLDGNETYRYETEPLDPDTDQDGLKDGVEKKQYGTDPIHPDSDADSLSDADEVSTYGTDPLSNDTDGDGLSDTREIRAHGTNATTNDTDGDGIPDKTEVEVRHYDPLEPNSLHEKRSNISVSGVQQQRLGDLLDVFVRLAHSLQEDDPNAGLIREYGQAITALPDADFTGSKATIIGKFKQAGLYQVLDLIETEFGANIPATALKGRLTQAIELGARMNSVLAVVSDYSSLHDQAERLVNATGENATAAKIGLITATAVLVIDSYLLYQTGGTFTLTSGAQLAFRATGQIAAKTKLARLAKYCGWKCVGGVERLIHWTLRSAIDIGETKLIGAMINMAYFDITGISIIDVLRGMTAEELAKVFESAKQVLNEEVIQKLKETIRQLTTDTVSDVFSNQRPLHSVSRTPSERNFVRSG